MLILSSQVAQSCKTQNKLTDHCNGGNYDAVLGSTECYACTQVGVPVFHSTSCDSYTAHHPHWQASAGSSLVPIRASLPKSNPTHALTGPFGPILDPRSQWVQWWNRVFLLARAISLAVDPLFFYALSLSLGKGGPRVFQVGLRVKGLLFLAVANSCGTQCHRFPLRKVAEGILVGCLCHTPISSGNILLLVPKLVVQEKIELVLTIVLLTFLFQFLPKLYHSFCLMSRMRKVTGYIFGTIWWGFGLNLVAYLIASHVIGGCWYVLATQHVMSCLKEQCERNSNCNLSLSCSMDVCYQFMYPEDKFGNQCGNNSKMIAKPLCLDDEGPFNHGIYTEGLLVVTSNSLAVRVLYPIFWGLLNLSSFGNALDPTSNLIEVVFSIFIVLFGFTLFTLMVGNIQVFLSVILAKNKNMQLKRRDIEWWMSRRQLPPDLRRRVRHFENQRWAVMGGEDEIKWMEELPEGLRRDIKRHLCVDLIRKAPLFHNLDDLILDNICDRVKPLIYSKGEKIIREGDPVPRMYFIVRGRVKRSQGLSKGMVATSVLEPGGFLGDELLSWCLRRPFIDRLPASSATFYCLESTEAFGLDANHLRYITDHFRYTFASQRLKRTLRYNSSNWRTWAAVNIQFAWRRYRMRTRGLVLPVVLNGNIENLLRRYAAMFMSLRPHDHLE
ncbi:hypothetical protein GH714_012159 [Hevea brasiliensis]|uniref:Cyclic nucleotide-binding domain-containing protein n=1 Tax=Hevea brasiliensis TaxID=3981 RepID=A0A6A6K5R5_HEVBR|nr:hypothetical protein GH714_012159 [Hevea brasiliensis]